MSPILEGAIDKAPETLTGDQSLTSTPVYFAGPIDYVEHRSPKNHSTDNWRHRFFGDMPIEMLCPTCLNEHSENWQQVMSVNRDATNKAHIMVAFFPGDVATFGTPIEVWEWMIWRSHTRRRPACLIHPVRHGAYVQMLEEQGLVIVRDFEEARAWLRRQLTERL